MRGYACKYVDEVYNKIMGQMYGVFCGDDPKKWASYYRTSISGCGATCLPSPPDFPICDPVILNCAFTFTDTTDGLNCASMFLTLACCGDIIIPTPPQATILGPFESDAEAAANGVGIGQEYYLAADNIYGWPSDGGLKKTRIA